MTPPKVSHVPHAPKLKEAPPRKGFLAHEGFQKLRNELPEYLKPVLTMGYYTGMRVGEVLSLRWEQVSISDRQVRLDPGTTKNDEARTIPLTGELYESLRMQKEIRDTKYPTCVWVFFRKGKRFRSFYGSWLSACERAGVPGLIFHDLRRSGVRNLVRVGVPEKVAMAISGHKTRSVFDRYNIVNDQDLRDAARKLGNYLNGHNSGRIVPFEEIPTENKSQLSH
jgi:integrase